MALSREARVREDLQEEAKDVLRNCEVSRESRRTDAGTFKQWYDLGSESGSPATNNKLRSHVHRLMSFCWSPDDVRFEVHLPPAARQPWIAAAALARDDFRQTWSLSGADREISRAFEWALVYGSMPIKIRGDAQRGFAVDAIDPYDFGVTREDQGLEDQDGVAHWYALSYPQFIRWVTGHPREQALIALANEHKQVPAGQSMGSVVVTGITGAFPNSNVSTVVPGDMPDAVYVQEAQVREPILQMVDVWQRRIYEDRTRGLYEDWRCTTLFSDARDVMLLTRRNPILGWQPSPTGVLAAEFPFSLLVPIDVPNYMWGRSALLDLMGLQKWREDLITDIRKVIKLQLNPAKFFSGIANYEDAGMALSSPGGAYGVSDPGAKMDPVKVEVGQEAFGMQQRIDLMFDDASGIPPLIAQGEQPGGVRANSQLLSLAGIGAGRIRHTALQLEATLSRVATHCFRLRQRDDDETYTAEDGTKFILAQLPPGTTLQVSAHSAAPIFSEQAAAKADDLLKAGAIDGAWYTELKNPPYREEIKEVAKRLAESKAKLQERMLEIEAAKFLRRGARK